jgi:RNA polymerase sigma factor (sigma-70 family)
MTEDLAAEDDDARLVARCRNGDAAAWGQLVRRYQRLVYTVARRAGLDEHAAADVFQAVFARLFEKLASLRQPERLHAWLVTSAKREALAMRRRQSTSVSLDEESADGENARVDSLADEGPLPEELLGELQLMHKLRLAMQRLDRRCHDLLTMLFADDERSSYDAVSSGLGLPVGSIGPTRARCLEKLRKLFAKL